MQMGGLIDSEGIYSKTMKKQKISHYITNWYIAAYCYKKNNYERVKMSVI